MASTVRISDTAHGKLRDLSTRTKVPMQTVLDRAIEAYRRQVMLEELNASYATLKQDPEAWAEYQRERAVWDVTLQDGLDTSELWTDDGTVTVGAEPASG